jgi:hypothetical protein
MTSLLGVRHCFAAAVYSVLIRFNFLYSSDFQPRKGSLRNLRQTAKELLHGNYKNPEVGRAFTPVPLNLPHPVL